MCGFKAVDVFMYGLSWIRYRGNLFNSVDHARRITRFLSILDRRRHSVRVLISKLNDGQIKNNHSRFRGFVPFCPDHVVILNVFPKYLTMFFLLVDCPYISILLLVTFTWQTNNFDSNGFHSNNMKVLNIKTLNPTWDEIKNSKSVNFVIN